MEGVDRSSPLHALLVEQTKDACRDAGDWFGVSVAGPVTVVWVTDSSELARRAGGDPGPVAGLAVASRRLVILYAPALQSRPDRIVSVLKHEVCHVVFGAATAGAEVEPPRWLNEGVAMWWSGEWDLGLAYRTDQSKLLRNAIAAGNLLSFDDLYSTFPQGPFFHVAYAQSRSFVNWIVRRHGEEALRQLIHRLGADEDLSPAFEAVYRIPLSEAELDWQRDVSGGILGRVPSGAVLINLAWGILGLLVFARFLVVRRRLRRLLNEPEGPDGRPPEARPPDARPRDEGPLDSRP